MKKTLLFVFITTLSISVFAQSLTIESFVSELSSRQSRVEEFKYIKKLAKDLGIKHVYMFGGTAAAWGHYVRWDMRREQGIEKLQPQRFDYDYTNIFRANQDFDIVIDGTIEQAEALELAVQEHFNYFSGTRPTWEVRLLKEQRADKDSIMGADFQNQHTDSHSTGLIDMMDCEGFDCVKDVRDIENSKSAFLMDMFEAKLHYYFSEKHKNTKRFKAGMNPEILSVIRYFTKVVQYELQRRPEDIKTIQKIIEEFKPSDQNNWHRYVSKWLDKNAKKLIVNAIDMEFSQKLLEATGLKKKLLELGDQDLQGSMGWWINKESLKSKPIGSGEGKRAAEIFSTNKNGEIIVAHETNSFSAYESIMKAHDGAANVLISRKSVIGEAALYGDGHYTKIGTTGARGTGLTIRYILNPNAREGSDFTNIGDIVIVLNRNVLEVIVEEIVLEPTEYFRKMISGIKFDFNDKGVVEKLKRRISRKMNNLSDIQKDEIILSANKYVRKKSSLNLILNTLQDLNLAGVFLEKNNKDVLKRYFNDFRAAKKEILSLENLSINKNELFSIEEKVGFINKTIHLVQRKHINERFYYFYNIAQLGLIETFFDLYEKEFSDWFDSYEKTTYKNVLNTDNTGMRTYLLEVGKRWVEWKVKKINLTDYLLSTKEVVKKNKVHYELRHLLQKSLIRETSKFSEAELLELEQKRERVSYRKSNEVWLETLHSSEIFEIHKLKLSWDTLVESYNNFEEVSVKKSLKKSRIKNRIVCSLGVICSVLLFQATQAHINTSGGALLNIAGTLGGISSMVLFFLRSPKKMDHEIKRKFSTWENILNKLPTVLNLEVEKKTRNVYEKDRFKYYMSPSPEHYIDARYSLKGFEYIDLLAKVSLRGIELQLAPKNKTVFSISNYKKEITIMMKSFSCNKLYTQIVTSD